MEHSAEKSCISATLLLHAHQQAARSKQKRERREVVMTSACDAMGGLRRNTFFALLCVVLIRFVRIMRDFTCRKKRDADLWLVTARLAVCIVRGSTGLSVYCSRSLLDWDRSCTQSIVTVHDAVCNVQ